MPDPLETLFAGLRRSAPEPTPLGRIALRAGRLRRRRRRRAAAGGLVACGLAAGLVVVNPFGGGGSGSVTVGPPALPGRHHPRGATGQAASGQRGATARPGELAYVSEGRLVVVGRTGGRRVVALPAGSGQPAELSWSADGRWLAFLRLPAGQQDPAGAPGSLWVVGADGHHLRQVFAGPTVGAFAWNPARDTLAVSVVAGATAHAHPLAVVPILASGRPGVPALPGGLTGAYVTGVAWSPTGTTLAAGADAPKPSGALGELVTVQDRPGPAPRVHVVATMGNAGFDLAGWWPSGRGLLYWRDGQFSSSIAADGLPLVAYDLATGRSRTLTTSLTYPDWLAWSPDGRTLAVVAGAGRTVWDGGKHLLLCQVPAGTCRPEPQAAGRTSLDPAWMPDGRLVWAEASGTTAQTMAAPPGVPGVATAPFEWRAVAAWAAAGGLRTAAVPGGLPGPAQPLPGGAGGQEPRPAGGGLVFVRGGALWRLPAGSTTPVRLTGRLGPYGPSLPGYYGYIPWYQTFAWHG